MIPTYFRRATTRASQLLPLLCLPDNGLMLRDVVVTSGMGVPLLIGTDVLEVNGGIIDYSRNVLVLGKREYGFVQRLTKSPGCSN